MKKTTVAVFIFSLFITFSWIAPREAHALTITPIRYEIAGNPGEVLEQKMTLVNETKKDQLLYVSFSNFEAQGDTGSPTFVEPKEGLGTWISTSQSTINLGAGEQKVINFKIEIPKDAEPGGHFAAIFWGTNPLVDSGFCITSTVHL